MKYGAFKFLFRRYQSRGLVECYFRRFGYRMIDLGAWAFHEWNVWRQKLNEITRRLGPTISDPIPEKSHKSPPTFVQVRTEC